MKFAKTTILSLLFSISLSTTSQANVEAVIGNLPLRNNPNIMGQLPKTSASEIIISRPQYVISYNKYRREPNWAAWKIDNTDLGLTKRSNNFQQDNELETYLNKYSNLHAVDPTEYRGSCYDRGHQVPSGDRTANDESNSLTFVMSNMIPQTPYLNRVIWVRFESYLRTLIRDQGKKLYIVAGPIFDQNLGKIGPNKDIVIPSKNFKVAFILNQNQTYRDINSSTPSIAVIMPNITKEGTMPTDATACQLLNPDPNQTTSGLENNDVPTSNDWTQYQTSIAQVEMQSHIQIFPR